MRKNGEVEIRNISPERPFSLSEERGWELRGFFAPEYGLYARGIGGRAGVSGG